MTTYTPDYIHEDLIDCERRGITGEVCYRFRAGPHEQSVGDPCRWGFTPVSGSYEQPAPVHLDDFRCEGRP